MPRKRIAFGASLVAVSLCAQQIITTFAGTDWVFPGDGWLIQNVPLSRECRLTTDPQGRIVFFDALNQIVGRVEDDGRVTVIAGNGLRGFSGDGGNARSASLNNPLGGAYDRSGNLYIVDPPRIRRVSPQGTITTFAGNGSGLSAGDGGPAIRASLLPSGIAITPDNSILVIDGVSRVRRIAPSGIISTFAGTGNVNFNGEGRLATETNIGASGLLVHPNGSVLISDNVNFRIYRVNTAGQLTVFAGTGLSGFSGDGGPATAARFSAVSSMVLDSGGAVLLADTLNFRIRRVSIEGMINTVAGNGQDQVTFSSGPRALDTGIGGPLSLAQDGQGRTYVSSSADGRILRFDPGFTNWTVWGGNGGFKEIVNGTPAPLLTITEPWGVATGPDGSLYISDRLNNRVVRVRPDGASVRFAGGDRLASCVFCDALSARLRPAGLAVDPQGRLVIADALLSVLYRVDRNGQITKIAGLGGAVSTGPSAGGFSGDNGPALNARLNQPFGVAIDPAGNIYVSDLNNNRVRRIGTDGMITTYAGNGARAFSGDNGPATMASLHEPRGLAFNAEGELLIADYWNHRIRAVSAAGVIRTWAGNGIQAFTGDGGQARDAAFAFPNGLASDAAGNVYVSLPVSREPRDSGGTPMARTAESSRAAGEPVGVIRRIAPNGIVSTFAGQQGDGFSGDGGIPANARFRNPGGIVVDRAGSVYIADTGNHRVRVVRTARLQTAVSPTAVAMSAIAGSSNNTPERVTISSAVTGLRYTTSVSYAQGTGWLTVTGSSETAPAVLSLSVNANPLRAGRYSATVNITTEPASIVSPVTITLTVSDAPPRLSLSTRLLSFSQVAGAEAEPTSLDLRNDGGGSLTYSVAASVTGTNRWLAVTPASGTLQAGQSATLTATADGGSLTPGTYQGAITITASGGRVTIPVSLTVRGARSTILVSQAGLTFTAVAGGGRPLPQQIGILNVGGGVLNWSAGVSPGWLRVAPASGTISTPLTGVGTVAVSVVPTGLPPGQYFDQVTITGDADNSPQLVTVVLNVLPEGTDPGPEVIPTGMIFISQQGENPGSQSIRFNHLGRGMATFESSGLGDWYNIAPGTGRALPDAPSSIIVQPDLAGLPPGIRRGAVTLQVQEDGTVRTVTLLSVVAPASAAGKASRAAFSCASDLLQVQFTSLREGFSARMGEASTVEVRVTDECANLLIPSSPGPLAQVIASPQNGPDIRLQHVGNGVWRGSWTPVSATASTRITVRALLSGAGAGGFRAQGGTASLSGAVLAQTGTQSPILTAGGVVHAASLTGGVPIAPGSLITLFGANLADSAGPASGLPLPSTLHGAEVRLGDRPLPILFANANQLNAQVPYDLPVDTQHQISVRRGAAISVPETLTVAATQPGIFTKSQTGVGQAAITLADGFSLAEPGTAARRGDTVIIYCSGLGPVTPAVESGRPAPSSPLSRVNNPVTVTIGGRQAIVDFAGLSPGFSGLYQINARIPADAPTGDAVEVLIESAGQRSRPVNIAVQ